MNCFNESTIEQAAIDWLKKLGYGYAFGSENTAGTLAGLQGSLPPKLMRGEVRVKVKDVEQLGGDDA